MLSEKAHYDHSLSGYLHKRTADSTKWQQRWFVLYQVSELFVMLRDRRIHDLLYLYCREKERKKKKKKAERSNLCVQFESNTSHDLNLNLHLSTIFVFAKDIHKYISISLLITKKKLFYHSA